MKWSVKANIKILMMGVAMRDLKEKGMHERTKEVEMKKNEATYSFMRSVSLRLPGDAMTEGGGGKSGPSKVGRWGEAREGIGRRKMTKGKVGSSTMGQRDGWDVGDEECDRGGKDVEGQ